MSKMTYTMPGYDVLLYANWIPADSPNALSQITTTNLKGQQLTNWTDITNKLASFSSADLNQPGSPILKVSAGGSNCYIDAAPIAVLNARQGSLWMSPMALMQVLPFTAIWTTHNLQGQTLHIHAALKQRFSSTKRILNLHSPVPSIPESVSAWHCLMHSRDRQHMYI